MKTYACSDLHGMYKLYKNICRRLEPDDVCVCLGDNVDRGASGYEIMKEMLDDKRFVYIKGNHEDMFVGGMLEELKRPEYDEARSLHFMNGGKTTYDSWINDGTPREYIDKLDKLPYLYTYCRTDGSTVLISHAGFTPNKDGVPEDMLLWDRSHFNDEWPDNYENMYVLHGHTPVANLLSAEEAKARYGKLGMRNRCITRDHIPPVKDAKTEPYFYCNGHKIDIDILSVCTNACILFNLDDFSWELISTED